jgi:hypothetical protein
MAAIALLSGHTATRHPFVRPRGLPPIVLALGLALPLVAASAPALAQQERPNTQTMTCSAAQALVNSRGAVLLNTGPQTYDRFVSGYGGCSTSGVVGPAWVPTRDNPQCALFVCQSPGRGNG